MNQQQRKYAIDRVNSILAERKKVVKAHCTVPAVTLTTEEKIALIRRGGSETEGPHQGIHLHSRCLRLFAF